MNQQKTFEGKKILIGVPLHFNLSHLFEKQLQHLGFEVINISILDAAFKYKNKLERVKSFFIKNFGNNKYYKNQLRYRRNETNIKQLIATHDAFDYALFIRPEVYPISFLKEIKKKTKNSFCAYQWDGLNRFPTIYNYIPLFDRFFVFDPQDLSVTGTLPITNFFFAPNIGDKAEETRQKTDVLYIGSYTKTRFDLLTDLSSKISKWGMEANIILVKRRGKQKGNRFLRTIKKGVDFQAAIALSLHTNTIIDIAFEGHSGLSFRSFEALGLCKKLITTNDKIVQYDFYHPSNVFVLTNSTANEEELHTFLNTPYQKLDPTIQEKYDFENWIKYVLDYGDYQTIQLPHKKTV